MNEKRRRGNRLILLLATTAALGVIVACVVYWDAIHARYRFYNLFESVGRNEQGYPEYRHRETGIVMVRVPGARFLMGSTKEEIGHYEPMLSQSSWFTQWVHTEAPLHEVVLSSFLIAKYEIKQAEWNRVMTENPSRTFGAEIPVEAVARSTAEEFCRKTALECPTEAQWEYACRAGENGPYGGTGRLTDMGWFKGNDMIGNRPHPVGIKEANAFGLHDMHGNLLEWCKDVFNPEFYSTPDAKGPDPICNTPRSKTSRIEWVCRGGSWAREAAECRSAFRFFFTSDQSDQAVELGLRPAFYPLPPGL